ncbi:hypothetical protein FH972_004774 [Carpinus fangiana]|uniref:MsrB domain-containing protein n=1 Tax=Carpinus fangiana TaxID=176857 RepID=A0A5N6QMK0_9ROSI|nr:hypothetical protein FH972_004774 [Carpinus fangiana]
MAINIRRAVPFSPSKTLIQNPTTKRTFSKLRPPPNSAPTYLFGTLFRPLAPKPIITIPISANGFGGLFYQSNRSFCGGDVAMAAPGSVQKSDEEWQIILSPGQYRVLRQKCTEKEWTGYSNWRTWRFYKGGVCQCAGCGTPLYSSTAKFTSKTGWPAFYEALPGAVTLNMDPDGIRTEISCAVCGGHLGHLFKATPRFSCCRRLLNATKRDLYRIDKNGDIDGSDLQLKLNEKSDGDLQLLLGKISAAGQSDGDQQNSAKKLCTMEWKNGWVLGNVYCCCEQEMTSNRSFCGGDVAMAAPGSVQKSDEEWQIILSPGQYRVLRQKCTEKEWIGYPNWWYYYEGVYECAGCGNPLYCSKAKFTSGIGWPAFYKALSGAITLNMDPDGIKTEISCAVCCGYIGRLFKCEGLDIRTDERKFTPKGSGTPTDEHHCVNSLALKFIPANPHDLSE